MRREQGWQDLQTRHALDLVPPQRLPVNGYRATVRRIDGRRCPLNRIKELVDRCITVGVSMQGPA